MRDSVRVLCRPAVAAGFRLALARQPLPIIVSVPLPTWAAPAASPEAFIAELLRRAIGYRVRLG